MAPYRRRVLNCFAMYANKHVIVTGGLGFIGSNLAIRLVQSGARVTLVDSLIQGCGANFFNIEDIRHRVKLIARDISDAEAFAREIAEADVIFNCAGEISHTMSMIDPERDLQINTLAQLRFLQVCRKVRPGIRIVFASTRQVYGRPEYLPVDELHPTEPVDFNGVHKFAAAEYHLLLTRRGEVRATVLQLSNVYGPRMALHLAQQGFLGTFVANSLAGKPLFVYGEGTQVRDPVFVDDAVHAFLLAGAAASPGPVYNIGGSEQLSLRTIAEVCARTAGAGSDLVQRPFPEAVRTIDIGSYWSDTRRIQADLGWQAGTLFEDGMRRTLEFYRTHLAQYSRQFETAESRGGPDTTPALGETAPS